MNVVDVYSISQKTRTGSYYLTLPDSAFSVEPEGICQLEPGHFLMASAVKGSTVFKLYETHLPIYHTITASAENGSVSQQTAEVDPGGSVPLPTARRRISVCRNWWWTAPRWIPQRIPTVTPSPMYRKITQYRRFTRKSPRYTVTTQAQNGTVDVNPSGFEHDPLTVSFAPNEHYELDSLLVDGRKWSFRAMRPPIPLRISPPTIRWKCVSKAIPSYTITVEAQNGTVSERKATRVPGRILHYPGRCRTRFYSLSRCLVDGRPGTDRNR